VCRAAASPLPSASRMFIIRIGEEGEPSRGSAFRVGWRPAPSSSIRGERGVRQPCEGGELRLRGVGRLRRRQLPRVWLLGLGGFGAASGAASCRLGGAGLSVHRTGDGGAVRRSTTPTTSPMPSAAPGVVQDVVHHGGSGVLGWSCPHSCSEDGSEDLFARALGWLPFTGTALVCRWPLSSVLRWSPPLVRLPTAEVVASAGKTVSATCRRTSGSLALMASLSPPIGRTGRGPFRSGVHAEMIAAAWRVVGAEVAATACADVVASAGEPPGASYPAALTGVEVVHTCRVEIELGLHLKTDVILSLFFKVLKSTIC
jgi:hypothetical protein